MGQIIVESLPVTVPCETGKVSDGFHTFDELYDHRCLLFLAFQALWYQRTVPYSSAWKSKKHADDTEWDGWFIAGLKMAEGDISYHIPVKFWDICKGNELQNAPEWDGHTSADVLKRLEQWLAVKIV